MRITDITPQQRNPSRRNLFVDDAFALGVSAETLLRFGLRKGDPITHALLQEIEKAEELVNAKGAALHYLGVRPRTVQEVRQKLREKEFGDEEIQRTIDDLTKAGLLNDGEFARMYIRDQMAKRPAGRLLLTRKLLLLGVARPVIEEALADSLPAEQTSSAAEQLARTFLEQGRRLRPNEPATKLRQRAAALLARRGFPWDVIQSVLKSVFAGTPEGDDDARPE